MPKYVPQIIMLAGEADNYFVTAHTEGGYNNISTAIIAHSHSWEKC